jgi:hypothetical protein
MDPIQAMGSLDNPKYPRTPLLDFMLGQKKVLKSKKVRQKEFLESGKDRYIDDDNDGVISGLDPKPYDGRVSSSDPFFACLDRISKR